MSEFGPKYKKRIKEIMKANNFGKFVGYTFQSRPERILLIGERGAATIDYNLKLLRLNLIHNNI